MLFLPAAPAESLMMNMSGMESLAASLFSSRDKLRMICSANSRDKLRVSRDSLDGHLTLLYAASNIGRSRSLEVTQEAV